MTSTEPRRTLPPSVIAWLLVASGGSLAMIYLTHRTGMIPQLIFGHDLFALLDGAWKWKWGSIPHVDYYSPVGVLTYAIIALGLRVSGNVVDAMPTAVALFALFLLPLLLFASFTRMRPALAAIATLVLMASVLAPHQLKFDSDGLTYCIIYNRWGYGLFCLVLLTTTVRPARSAAWIEVLDGLIAGSCVVLAIFLKISYGLLAFAVLASWAVIHLRNWRYYGCAVLGFAGSLVGVGYVLQWRYSLFLHDIGMAFRARAKIGVDGLVESVFYLYPDLCLLALLTLLLGIGLGLAGKWSWPRMLRTVLFLACYALAAVGVIMSNAPNGSLRESPVLALGALVLLSGIYQVWRDGLPDDHVPAPFLAGTRATGGVVAAFLLACILGGLLAGAEVGGLRLLFLLAVLWACSDLIFPALGSRQLPLVFGLSVFVAVMLVLPATKRNIRGLAYAARLNAAGSTLTPSQTVQVKGAGGIQIKAFGGDPPLPTTYAGKVEDALALLEQTGNADATVNVLDFSNPLNVVRAVKPSQSGPTAWQLDIVYSRKAMPRASKVFTPGELVMLPKQFGDGRQENLKVLRNRYGKYLAANFHPPVESAQWQLFIPRTMPGYQAAGLSPAGGGLVGDYSLENSAR